MDVVMRSVGIARRKSSRRILRIGVTEISPGAEGKEV